MSRIGKNPVPLPDGVKVSVTDRQVVVQGAKNKLTYTHRPEVKVRVDGGQVVVERHGDSRTARAVHGLTRALINNMVLGVTKGFSKELEVVGVGWAAKLVKNRLELSVGYGDTRIVAIPAGLTVEVQGSRVKITGPDKQAVGQLAAEVRSHRKPEPYKGKGIKYIDEIIVRKQGKAIASGS